MRQFIKSHWGIILLLALALFVRIYRLESTLTFLEDEGRDLLVVKRMFDTGKPALLGPQTSTGNMYLGPAYYYFIAPSLLVSDMSPLGPAAFIALTGVLTVYLLYYLGHKWYSGRVGYLAALLYALLPLPIAFTRNSWNPNLAPLISLVAVWMTARIVRGEGSSRRNYLALGASLGFLVQLHYMALLLVAAIGLALLVSSWHKLKQLFLGAALALLAAFVTLSPFVIFEVRNNWVNTRAITRFVEAKEEHNIRYSLPVSLWWYKVESSATRLFASTLGKDSLTPDPYRTPLAVLAFLTIILAVFSRRRDKATRLLLALLCLPLALLGIYQENVHLHYLGFLFPLVYLLVAASPLGWLVGLLCLAYTLPQTASYLTSSGTNQLVRAREVASYIETKSGGEPYNVVSIKGTTAAPYLYYLALSDTPPTTALANKLFVICEQELCQSDDLASPYLYITGPAHPTLTSYLGHPLYNYQESARTVVSSEHVSHGAFVTTLTVAK